METNFLNLVFILFGSLVITCLIALILWAWLLGPSRIKSVVTKRMSPAQMREKLKAQLANLLVFTGAGLLAAAALLFFSYAYFGKWVYETTTAESWQGILADWLMKQPFTIPMSSDTGYDSVICVGSAIAVCLGIMVGGFCGKILGMKMAARQFDITKALL